MFLLTIPLLNLIFSHRFLSGTGYEEISFELYMGYIVDDIGGYIMYSTSTGI